MLGSGRRQRSQINAWPGYVDALSALLMLVIFMLMIYMVSQLYLSQTLSDRDTELANLNSRLNEISRLLMLEEQRSEQLVAELTSLKSAYQQSLSREEAMQQALDSLLGELSDSEEAQQIISARAAELESQIEQERRAFAQLQTLAGEQENALLEEQELTASQQDFILKLTQRIDALQDQLRQISAALQLQETLVAERDVEIAGLGQRLNVLLAERVNELERYQSEFFRRLRDLLEDNENIRIVDDRFLLPSELFFASGVAELGAEGRMELRKLADLLLEIADTIPEDVDWVLQIEGHTDRVPINTASFPSNWELSTARAVSVVRYLASQGVPERHLAAAGFGEFSPIDSGNSAEAFQRNRRIEIKLTNR